MKTDQETEKKMDSGIYDMKASLHRKEIEEIKMALKKENYKLEERRYEFVYPISLFTKWPP